MVALNWECIHVDKGKHIIEGCCKTKSTWLMVIGTPVSSLEPINSTEADAAKKI